MLYEMASKTAISRFALATARCHVFTRTKKIEMSNGVRLGQTSDNLFDLTDQAPQSTIARTP